MVHFFNGGDTLCKAGRKSDKTKFLAVSRNRAGDWLEPWPRDCITSWKSNCRRTVIRSSSSAKRELAEAEREKVFTGKEMDRAADKSHLHAITLRAGAIILGYPACPTSFLDPSLRSLDSSQIFDPLTRRSQRDFQ